MPQFHPAKFGRRFGRGKKDHNVGESEKYLHVEDMEDHDIHTKENEEGKEEPTGINETDEQAAIGLDKYADHNIEEVIIFIATNSIQEISHKFYSRNKLQNFQSATSFKKSDINFS